MKLLLILFLLLPIVSYSQQDNLKAKKSLNLKISTFMLLEEQGYQENASNGYAQVLIIDKTGPAYNYGTNIQLSNRILSNFELDYGLGLSITSHNFDYSLTYSSSSDYLGFANEKNHGYYLTVPISFYYHNNSSKRFSFSPGIIIRPQFLILHHSQIIPNNYVFDFLESPGSQFKNFVPKASLDISLGCKINERVYLMTGFILENNPKYYKEPKSDIYFLPISIGLKISLTLTNL